jgi:hypothetical protein
MDFDLSEAQHRRLDAVSAVVDAAGSSADGEQVDKLLLASDVLDGSDLLDGFMITEELARRGLGGAFGLHALVGDLLPEGRVAGRVAVAEAQQSGPVRFADSASTLIVLDGVHAVLYDPSSLDIRPENTVYGFPFAHVRASGAGRRLPDGHAARIRARWRLALTAEIAGNARSAIAKTADHLTSRRQFGRPLASFQALRHRLADAAVSAEATSWLGREAAFTNDDRAVVRAAWYASNTASTLVPELVQMCGARSFTIEFGLHVFTMRMNCLRLELRGIDRLGLELCELAPARSAGGLQAPAGQQ